MIKKFILGACILLLPHVSFAANAEGNFSILAYGIHSCGKFIDAVNDGNNNNNWIKWNTYQAYTFGYFTGTNQFLEDTDNIKGTTDMEGIMAFMEKYCRENPLKQYFDAIDAVTVQLYPQRSK